MAAATMAQQNGVAEVVMPNGSAAGVNGKALGPSKDKKQQQQSKDAQQPTKPHFLSLQSPFQPAMAMPPFPSPSSSLIPPPDLTETLKLRPMSAVNANGHFPSSPSQTKVFIPPPPLSPPLQQPASPPATPKPQRASADISVSTPVTPQAPSHAKALSLSSSRRAPPSPSMSRRASGASKRHSTASMASSRNTNRASLLSQSITTPDRAPAPIKIRDFAYLPSDDRHVGKGVDAPKPNRRQSTLSTSSTSSSRRSSGWGSFKWTSGTSRLWGFGFGKNAANAGDDEDEDDDARPSRSDFERNFDISSPTEERASYEEDDESSSDQEYVDADDVLVPGLYRAMFPFTPEGESEMALEEGQVVQVVGRGGGQGWAVVTREESSEQADKHALVPESYLELVKADEWSGDE